MAIADDQSSSGVHISTLLYSDEIPESVPRHPIRGAILAQVPFHFGIAQGSRQEVLDGYFGAGKAGEKNPLELRKKSKDNTDTAVLIAEFDPEDEIAKPVSIGKPKVVKALQDPTNIWPADARFYGTLPS